MGSVVKIDPAVAIPWVVSERNPPPGSPRDRLLRAQAEKVELENARRRGELILSSQVGEVLSTLGADLAQRHEGVPGRVCNEFAGLTDPAVIRERLLDELRTVRGAFSDATEKLTDAMDDGSAGDSPRSRTVSKRKRKAPRKKR